MGALANIINTIRTARYGRDMRTAIANGFELIDHGGGGGGTPSIDCTLAEYQQLTPAEDTNYFITDKNYIMRNGVKYAQEYKIVPITESAFEALETKDPYTQYNIYPDPEEQEGS